MNGVLRSPGLPTRRIAWRAGLASGFPSGMFFVLSKTLDLLIDPLAWIVGPLAVGLFLLARERRRRLAFSLCALGLGVLFLGSLPPVANRLWHSLESQAVSTIRADVTYDAVVLLGGMVSPMGSTRENPAWNDNIERLLTTRELLRAGRARAVIVTGGHYGTPGLPTEAEYLAKELEALGIEEERIILENRALNTRENATLTKAIVEARGLKTLLVVTSAFHLRRAKGCFEAVGLDADYLPVDYRMRDPALDTRLMPRADSLGDTAKALRERVGLLVYQALGYAK